MEPGTTRRKEGGEGVAMRIQGFPSLPESIVAFLEQAFSSPCATWAFHPLQGDASDRSYYRVLSEGPGFGSDRSFILMQLGQRRDRQDVAGELPFVNIARHLAEKGVRVPEVCVDASEHGLVLLEDLGDVTLESFLRTCSPDERVRSYREAVRILVHMQKEGSKPSSSPCVALSYAFDAPTFLRELRFFREHAIEGLWGRTVSERDRGVLDGHFLTLCREIAGYPQVFTHRDFHSRNLMVGAEGLSVLDFQDARMGPVTYDLASLLRDSYVCVEPEMQQEMLSWYRELGRAKGIPVPEGRSLWSAFVRTGLQRNLKAIGTFAYQTVVKGADRYRDSIPPTLRLVRFALEEAPDLDPFRKALEGFLPPLV
jgi:N-acetylmuramate 1-kinase